MTRGRTPPPRVRAICAECGAGFEVAREGEALCPGCGGGRLDEEARAAWRAYLAGYDDGWRIASSSFAAEHWRAAIASYTGGNLARYVAGLRSARRCWRRRREALAEPPAGEPRRLPGL